MTKQPHHTGAPDLIEITPAMLKAGEEAFLLYSGGACETATAYACIAVLRAMLSAATPPRIIRAGGLND